MKLDLIGKKRRTLAKFCLSALLTIPSACSLSSLPTTDGLLGATAGAVVGGGIGNIIGDHLGKKTENTAIAAGVGALSGLAIGGLIHDNRMEIAKEDAQVIREAELISSRQKEIDEVRKSTEAKSSWGRSEVKPWQDRYQIETSEYPYQGPGL